jgi:hypothetical protein
MKTVIRCILAIAPLLLAAPVGAQQKQPPALALPSISPEAQLALDELSPRFGAEIGQIQGWFRDKPVLYFNFGEVGEPVAAGRVVWPIHGFDARGYPVAMRGQRPIFSTIPGLDGYSGLWRLSYVVIADLVQPNQLRDVASVDALVDRKRAALHETTLTLNLPIVARGSRLANDTTSGMLGWYQGRDVQYFDFGPASVTPASMWRFSRGNDAAGEPIVLMEQNSIVDSLPVSAPYPDLWEIHVVSVDSAFMPNSLKSASALQRTSLPVVPHNSVRNLPITMVDGARVERAASPLRAFADLRSPFPPAPTRP